MVGDRTVPAGEDGQRDQELLADALQEGPAVAARPGAAVPVPSEPAATAADAAEPEPAAAGEPTAGAAEPAGAGSSGRDGDDEQPAEHGGVLLQPRAGARAVLLAPGRRRRVAVRQPVAARGRRQLQRRRWL
jgi:hypothetical protein